MNPIKTGRFIAETRKQKNMTQRQLADALLISDKTVSKWECGKGLPEISLMMPLCEILEITVNDLLCGKRVYEDDYKIKAEENMMNLIKENEENKKKLIISIICGSITIIAVLALIIIASFISMPTIARIAIIILAVATAAFGIGAAVALDIRAGYFECPYCNELFVPTAVEYIKGIHTIRKRKLTCPCCKKRSMCLKRVVR